MRRVRALTMLNQSGDTTLVWTEDRDDEMERIIQAKMDAGCTFFVIEPRFGTRTKLKSAGDASKTRMLAIPDEEFAKFVSASGPSRRAQEPDAEGADVEPTAAIMPTPAKPARVTRKAKTAREAATSETVGVQPRRGG